LRPICRRAVADKFDRNPKPDEATKGIDVWKDKLPFAGTAARRQQNDHDQCEQSVHQLGSLVMPALPLTPVHEQWEGRVA
jgi:hypothetical protein